MPFISPDMTLKGVIRATHWNGSTASGLWNRCNAKGSARIYIMKLKIRPKVKTNLKEDFIICFIIFFWPTASYWAIYLAIAGGIPPSADNCKTPIKGRVKVKIP